MTKDNKIGNDYPAGTRISRTEGGETLLGTVKFTDGAGLLHVSFDSGEQRKIDIGRNAFLVTDEEGWRPEIFVYRNPDDEIHFFRFNESQLPQIDGDGVIVNIGKAEGLDQDTLIAVCPFEFDDAQARFFLARDRRTGSTRAIESIAVDGSDDERMAQQYGSAFHTMAFTMKRKEV